MVKLKVISILPSLVVETLVVEIRWFQFVKWSSEATYLNDHVTYTQDGWDPLIESSHPPKFVGHRHCGSGLRGRFQIPSFQSTSTVYVYLYMTWLESTHHIILITSILVTRTKSSNWRNIWKQILPVRPKRVLGRRKFKK